MGTDRSIPTSRITSKYQATIPRAVRRVLGLKQGDRIGFQITDKQVKLRKITAADIEYMKALEPTMSEWSSKNDEDAYRNL